MIITQYRWKCDFCGVYSPVTEPDTQPPGWVIVSGTAVSDGVTHVDHFEFCCDRHFAFWNREKDIKQ